MANHEVLLYREDYGSEVLLYIEVLRFFYMGIFYASSLYEVK